METDQQLKLSQQQSETLAKLKQWLYSAGANYDHLEVKYLTEGYRGVITNQPIKKNTPIVYIPKSQLITLQMAKQDLINKEIISKKVELTSPKHTYLAIFLLQQMLKEEQSKWKLYLDLLPKDLSNFPINYKNQELYELVGSPFLIQIHQKVYDVKKDYDRVCVSSEQFRKYKFRDFCWARTIVGSRIFGLYINGIKTDILAPFADMLNHRLPKQTTWNYIDEREGFVIQSLQDILGGVQVFDSYGKKCNSRYLLNYGFVVEKNNENQVCLKVQIDGPLKQKKLEMLQKMESCRILKMSANLHSSNFYESMGFLRFREVSDPNPLTVLEKISGIKLTGQPYLATKTPPITMQIECAIWQTLKQLCENALKDYATTKEQDEALLKNELSQNIRNIVILRLGQKKVLLKLIGYSNEVLAILRQGFAKSVEYLSANQDKDWSKYLTKILKLMPGYKQKKFKDNIEIYVEQQQKQQGEQQLQNS